MDMDTRVRTILENWIKDTTTVDDAAQGIISAAHKYIRTEIMDFQFKGSFLY
jgi:hypothetical protein